MLENLDTKYLGTLRHAYGYATDVPQLLNDICSDSKEVRNKAYYELFGNIWHQGTIYEATVYVFPFLIELFLDPTFPHEKDKDELAMLIASIAAGESCYYDPRLVDAESKKPFSPQLEKEKEKQITEQIQKESHKIILKLLPYLEHKEGIIRESIAQMLPFYPDYYDITLPALEKAISSEKEEDSREYMEEALNEMKKTLPNAHKLRNGMKRF